MPPKHDFPPIQYKTQIQYSSSNKSTTTTHIVHHIDQLTNPAYLKQYFALDFAKRNQIIN